MLDAWFSQIDSYPGLLVFCGASGLAVPVPEDVALLWAGMRVAEGQWRWVPTVMVALIGVQARDLAAWGLGRLAGDAFFESRWAARWVGRRAIARAQRLVAEHGALAVLAGRFFVGFRAPVFMVAGAMHLPVRQFLRWDFVGLLVTVPAVLGLGYAFGAPLLETTRWALAQSRWLAVAIVLGGAAWAWQRRGRAAPGSLEDAAAGDPDEL